MELVIGGYGEDLAGYSSQIFDIKEYTVIDNFETIVKNNIEKFSDDNFVSDYIYDLKQKNVIVCGHEIGYGIIPIEKNERDYRELYGRVMCDVAKEADSVMRVICGIGQRIK